MFANMQQNMMQLYCSKNMNNAYKFFWKRMAGICKPAFLLAKIAFKSAPIVLPIPDWGCTGQHAHWRTLLDHMTLGMVDLIAKPMYVPMQTLEWTSCLPIVHGTLTPVPLCNLDETLLRKVMAKYCGLVLKRKCSEHVSITRVVR